MSVWTQLFVGERPVDQPEQVNVEGSLTDISRFKKAVKLAWPNNLQHVDASAIRVYASEDEKREHPLSNRAIVTAKFTSLVAVAPAPLSRTVEDITTELEQLKQQIAADERELIEKQCPAEKRLELLREPYARRNFLENELKAERMFPSICTCRVSLIAHPCCVRCCPSCASGVVLCSSAFSGPSAQKRCWKQWY